MLAERVKKNIAQYQLIQKGDLVLIGVSGGADSLALLDILFSLQYALGFSVTALHVNHGLRAAESDADEAFVREFCDNKGIPCFVERTDIKAWVRQSGKSIEEAARDFRYDFFYRECQRLQAHKIVTAHHMQDQAETVLMHLIRGAGLDGLCGMRMLQGKLIRPFMNISRGEIESYCTAHALMPRVDASNEDQRFMRNKVRHKLIPFIQENFNPEVISGLCKLAEILQHEKDYLDVLTQEKTQEIIVIENQNEIFMDIKAFQGLHEALKRRILREILRKLKGNLKQIENTTIQQILHLAEFGRTGSRLTLPGGAWACRSYDRIQFCKKMPKEAKPCIHQEISIPGELLIENIGKFVFYIEDVKGEDWKGVERDPKALEQYFDYDTIKGSIFLRSRKAGDYFRPFGGHGSKKLKAYLIDKKIEREQRDRLHLIALEAEILWIVGTAVSAKYPVSPETQRRLCMKFVKNK